MKKLIIHTNNVLQSITQVSNLTFKGPRSKSEMCRYFAFKEAPNDNCNLKVICFQRAPTATEMCKYSAFKLHWRGPYKKL